MGLTAATVFAVYAGYCVIVVLVALGVFHHYKLLDDEEND